MNECKEFPFTIVNHEEIPLGYPSAGLYRHLHLTNQGGTSVSPRSVRRHLYTLASDRTFKAVGEPFGRSVRMWVSMYAIPLG